MFGSKVLQTYYKKNRNRVNTSRRAAISSPSGEMNEGKRKRRKNSVLSLPPPFSSLLPDKNNMAAKILQFPCSKPTKG